VIDLLKQCVSWMVLVPSQHLLDVIYHQPFVRCRKKKNAICDSIKGCYRRVIVIICLNRLNKTLCCWLSSTVTDLNE
jgi:hypothetical protein